jgi:hypothetical protein
VLFAIALIASAFVLNRIRERRQMETTAGVSGSSAALVPAAALADAALKQPGEKLIYPYSVIPGGVDSVDALKAAIERDPVVAQHYQNFDLSKARLERLETPRVAHVSYRIGNDVFWTRKQLVLPAGERVITDGSHIARTRCGNQLADAPAATSVAEPSAEVLDTPVVQKALALAAAHPAAPPGGTPAPVSPGARPAGGGGVSHPSGVGGVTPGIGGSGGGAPGGITPTTSKPAGNPPQNGTDNPPANTPPGNNTPPSFSGNPPGGDPPGNPGPPSFVPPVITGLPPFTPPGGNPFVPPGNPFVPPGNPFVPPGTPGNPNTPTDFTPNTPGDPGDPGNPGNPGGPNTPECGVGCTNPHNPDVPVPVPEPGSMALMALGLGAAAARLRRR